MGLFGDPLTNGHRDIRDLVRREAVLHLEDGETTLRGFVLEFFPDALLVAKPTLLVPDEKPTELAGEALVFRDQIKFVQLLGSG